MMPKVYEVFMALFRKRNSKREWMKRLRENEDFLRWQEGFIRPFIATLEARLLDESTRGYANDFIKKHLKMLRHMTTQSLAAAEKMLSKEISEMENQIIAQEASNARRREDD